MFNLKKILHSDVFLFLCFFIFGLVGYLIFTGSQKNPESVVGDYSSYFTQTIKGPILYTREKCQYCVLLKAYFNEQHIEYIEKDIEKNIKAKQQYEKLGAYGTPLVLFTDELIIGFRKKMILDKLNNTKSALISSES